MDCCKIQHVLLFVVFCSLSIGEDAPNDNCAGIVEWMGNGYCDEHNNNEECGYDQGDCCECTCVDGSYFACPPSTFSCLDPNSGCLDTRATEYPNCTSYVPEIGDGSCDQNLNYLECGFDGGDCCECTCVDGLDRSCVFSDFHCVDPNSNCVDPRVAKFSNCRGNLAYAEDGVCDDINNNPDCGFDWGDCCPCTVNNELSTGHDFSSCLDPDAAEVLHDCNETPASPLPCLSGGEGPLVVEAFEDVSILAETVYCTSGEFEVEWRGHVVLEQGIVVPGGTVLNVTGVGPNATIDGGGMTRLFTIVNASLHVNDVTITNGSSVSGGAIYSSNSTMIFHRTIFAGNNAYLDGGATVMSDGSNVYFHDTNFSSNKASFAGGALHLANNSRVSWTGVSTLSTNTAKTYGGAIYMSGGGNASWDGVTTFSKNVVGLHGGAVYVSKRCNASWSEVTTFSGNVADRGGAVSVGNGGKASWAGVTTYSGNVGHNVAGAVGVREGGHASWTGMTTFLGNSAEVAGGAVSMNRCNASWAGKVIFSENYAHKGGAVSVTLSEVSWAGEVIFSGNIALGDGGGVNAWASSLSFSDVAEAGWGTRTLFFNNTAESGGALFVTVDSNVEWNGKTNFTSNIAYSDGGAVGSMLAVDESVLVFKGSTHFINNEAGANGGGMALLGALSVQFNTTDVAFDGNVANVSGGGVYISATGIGPTFIGTRFDSNSAQLGGGVFATGSGTKVTGLSPNEVYYPTKFIDCTFVNNVAHAAGGAVNAASGKEEYLGTLFAHNSAGVGGGLRLAGEALLSNCSFDENESDSDGGPAVSNIGFVSNLTSGYFRGNRFRCEAQHFFIFIESHPGELYGKVCDGCPSHCTRCDFENPRLIPQCISLAEAGVEHASSRGGLSTVEDLLIFEGYWRATNTSTDVKKCYNTDACKGGLTTKNDSCNSGYRGPYCAICTEGHAAKLGFTCRKCSGNTKNTIFTCVFGVAGVILVSSIIWYLMSSERQEEGQGPLVRRTLHSSFQSVKIIIVAWQILTQFASVANLTFPNVYQNFLDVVNVLNFDLSWVVSPGCYMDYDFYDRLKLTTIGPVVTIGFIGIAYAVAAHKNRFSESALRTVRQKHASVALLVSLFVYSNVSAVVFQTFACDPLDDGNSYLRADYSIECGNKTHEWYKIYATIMILVYPMGIPAFYAGVLFSNRHIMMDETRSEEDVVVKSTANLWEPYKPSRFYYEVIECFRRITLTGVVVFIYPDSTAQVAVTLMVAAVFAMTAESLAPYQSRWDAWVSRAGHVLVTMSMYVALLLKVDVSDEAFGSQKIFEATLVVAHVCLVVAVVVEAVAMVCTSRKTRQHPDPIMRTVCPWNAHDSLVEHGSTSDTSHSGKDVEPTVEILVGGVDAS